LITQGEILVTINDVNKRFSDKDILKDANFGINSGDKIGLIGVNGCGKTTYLKILAGVEPVDTGTITFRNNITVSYLTQEPQLDENLTVLEQLYSSEKEEFKLLSEYNKLTEELEKNPTDELWDRQAHLAELIDQTGAWSIEAKAKSYLTQLGLTEFNTKINILSGGQRRKVDLASIFLKEPDILILDEPTNHLDIDSIEWMQHYLAEYKGTLVFVTHDRYFLDSVCNKIMEIEQGSANFYNGNYSYYIEKKEIENVDTQRKETRRKAQLHKELKWLKRGARARSSKPKHHVDKVMELLDKSYLIEQQDMDISFQTHRMGKKILEVSNVGHRYGDKELFSNVSHVFQKFERIGIIGDNGCGKTTLIKILTKALVASEGSVHKGINTKIAYFKQEVDDMDGKISVYDYIANYAENIRTKDGVLHSATEMLERFLFEPKMQQAKLSSLSGGEKRRLYLLKSLMFGANFIILDEPTNDLDIRTLEILEDFLDAFDGCILVVSHDRFFLDRICDFLFVFDDGKIKKFAGNYSDYLLVKRFQIEDKKDKEKDKKAKVKTKKVKLSFKEKKEYETIQDRIAILEDTVEQLTQKIEKEAHKLTAKEFAEISQKQDSCDEELLTLLERWEELEEKIAQES